MRVIFSRKGFDSAAGGAPSPIIDGGPVSLWRVPSWLGRYRLSYPGPRSWTAADGLRAARRGQEFVVDVGDDAEPAAWVERVIRLIREGAAGATGAIGAPTSRQCLGLE